MTLNTHINPATDIQLEKIDGWKIYSTQQTIQLYLIGKNYIIFINGIEATKRLLVALNLGIKKIKFSIKNRSETLKIHYGDGRVLNLVNFNIDRSFFRMMQSDYPMQCTVSPAVVILYGHPPIPQENLPSGKVLQVRLRG